MRLKQNKRVLLLDNYDAFTNNLANQFDKLGATVLTSRPDEYSIIRAKTLEPTHLFLTPGNGDYDKQGQRLQEFVHAFHKDIPISGVCLGHQCVAAFFGAKIDMNIVSLMEEEMDKMNLNLPELNAFILPGGSVSASYCHIASMVR